MVVIQLQVRVQVQRSRFLLASPTRTSDSNDASPTFSKLFNPTKDHATLRKMVWNFATREMELQAIVQCTSLPKAGLGQQENGRAGPNCPGGFWGADLDAAAMCIVPEELSYSDPAM